MDAGSRVAGERAGTLGELALDAGERGERIALRQLRRPARDRTLQSSTVTYRRLRESAVEIAAGLIGLGIERGETVAILAATRAEWTTFELGTMCAGAVLAPIYHTSSPPECGHVLRHSQARVVLCESERDCAKIAAVAESCPDLRHVLILEGEAEGAVPLAGLMRRGREDVGAGRAVRSRLAEVQPDDVATIVYTSGTTGGPKGCRITHRNLLETSRMYRERIDLPDEHAVIYVFLPLAHVLARIAAIVVIASGGTLVYWSGDPDRIVEELAEAQPTHFVAVPRVYEKIHNAVIERVEERGPIVRLAFAWALEVGRRARRRRRARRDPDGQLSKMRLAVAERIGLKAVRELFGPQLELALVGAAQAGRRLLEFFDACGVLVLEGYGLTESCAAATLNPLEAPRFGTTGPALPGTSVKIAPDGEILIAGPHVFAGYHRDPVATAGAVSDDGWLATGDLGSLSPDGYLSVTGRKKDLIITSSGKNIAPAEIENALRESRWISEAVVYGDRRPYLVAMLTLDRDELPALGDRLGIEHPELETLATDERVRRLLWDDVAETNERFSRVEQVKRFAILPCELTEEAGELTPTLKVRRAAVYEKHASFFDRLYEEVQR
jgi:long-chain acyl-CoA synthetase